MSAPVLISPRGCWVTRSDSHDVVSSVCYYIAWSDWGCCCDCCSVGCWCCGDATVILCPMRRCCRPPTLMIVCNEPDSTKDISHVLTRASQQTYHFKDDINCATVSLCLPVIHLKATFMSTPSKALDPGCSRRAEETVLDSPLVSMLKMSFVWKRKY